jgi:putative ABC transport system permease protein
MKIFFIAWKNAWNKAGSTSLTLILLACSVGIISLMLLLENQLHEKFDKNIKDIDFVLGAKGSPLQLILANVYHIDAPTGNIKIHDAQRIVKNPTIKEAIPLAYGDNYEGWRIVGTNHRYAEFYGVQVAEGRVFDSPYEVTLGSFAAKELGLKIGDTFKSNHGLDKEGGEEHEHDDLFKVVGIYAHSGTVIDRLMLTPVETLWLVHEEHDHEHEETHLSVESADEHAMHSDSSHAEHIADGPVASEEAHVAEDAHAEEDHEDEREVTAYLLIKRLPMAPMILPNMVKNTNMQLAIPAIEINRLNENFGIGASIVRGVAAVIMLVSFLSVFVSLYNALKERKYELAVMRTMGGGRFQLFMLILVEGLMMVVVGTLIGFVLSRFGLILLSDAARDSFHDEFNPYIFLNEEGIMFAVVMALGVVASLLPALRAFFMDISKTLSNE